MIRGLTLLVLAAGLVRAESLDEAVRALAKRVATRLAPGETVLINSRNLSSVSAADFQKAKATLEQALRRRAPRNAMPVEVALTVSESVRGFLAVAEIRRPNERVVEMVSFRPDQTRPRAPVSLQKRLLWEQETPMLDVVVAGEEMLVLDVATLTLYRSNAARWELVASQPVSGSVHPVRDPRGRMEVAGAAITVYLQGAVCRGEWKPALRFSCETEGEAFRLAGESVRFTPERNTLESNGWPPFYSLARVEERSRPLYLAPAADGLTHLYDADRRPAGSFAAWGGEAVSLEGACVSGRYVLASRAGENDGDETAAIFEIENRRPVEASDTADFPGQITALWPIPGGAVAIARTTASGRYAAYSLTVDCRQ